MSLEDFRRLGNPLIHQLGGVFRRWRVGFGRHRSNACRLWVGISNVAVQARAAQKQCKTIMLHRLNSQFNTGDGNLLEQLDALFAFFGGNTSRATIRNFAVRIYSTEITANGDITRLDFKTDSGGFQHAASDFVLNRLVTEQTQMSRPAARSDAA